MYPTKGAPNEQNSHGLQANIYVIDPPSLLKQNKTVICGV